MALGGFTTALPWIAAGIGDTPFGASDPAAWLVVLDIALVTAFVIALLWILITRLGRDIRP